MVPTTLCLISLDFPCTAWPRWLGPLSAVQLFLCTVDIDPSLCQYYVPSLPSNRDSSIFDFDRLMLSTVSLPLHNLAPLCFRWPEFFMPSLSLYLQFGPLSAKCICIKLLDICTVSSSRCRFTPLCLNLYSMCTVKPQELIVTRPLCALWSACMHSLCWRAYFRVKAT